MLRSNTPQVTRGNAEQAFQHDLLEYRGSAEGTNLVGDLIFSAERHGSPVLVAGPTDRLDLLRRRLAAHSAAERRAPVRFIDLEGPLRNPALLGQILVDFVAAHPVGPLPLGITEVSHAGRTTDELAECELHASLLGELFADSRPWRLASPLDVGAVSESFVQKARRRHAATGTDAPHVELPPLSPAAPDVPSFDFDEASARATRAWAVARGRDEGLDERALESLEIVAGELTVNSIMHGGGAGTIRIWSTPAAVVCEVEDEGWMQSAIEGRRRPDPLQLGGRGLWIVNQFCSLVQIRSSESGTVVRAHVPRDARVT